jgi:rhodanese-related sulfurtransferase
VIEATFMMALKLTPFSQAFSFLDQFSRQISAQALRDFLQLKRDDVLLIDVRSQPEYDADHLPQAILIPLSQIEQGAGIEQIRLMLKGRQLIVYCTIGKRSQRALHLLQAAGFSGLNLKGGIQAWHRSVKLTQAKG